MILDFFQEQPLSFDHVKALAASLFDVARVDGVHDREMALIREFYESCSRAGDPPLEEVVAEAPGENTLKTLFGSPDMSKLFVKSMMLLAFADGTYARPEDQLIKKYGAVLGLTSEQVDALHASTKEFLLGSLAHIQNIDALKAVARSLDLK